MYLACAIPQPPAEKRNRQNISKQTLDQSPWLLCCVNKWKSSLLNGSGTSFKTEMIQTNTAPLRRHPLHKPSLTCYISVIQAQMHRSKQYARILLLDFSKAFDLINHNILLQKIASFGLPNIFMKWVVSFLNERTQQVKLGNTQSDWNHLHGGVPQGIKLGPVLRPYDKWSTNKVRLLHICWCISTGSDSQVPNLQEAADAAYMWTIQNDMIINKSKTKQLVIDFSKTRTNFPTIRIDGTDTQRVTEAKILGITITSNLTWMYTLMK